MIKDPGRTSDGFTELSGGMDSGVAPSIIRQNQVANMVNATVRGVFIKPRPGMNKRLLKFPGLEPSSFEDGKFQGAKAYRTSSGDDVLMAAISGRMFKVDIADQFTVQDVTIPGNPNSSLLEQVWMEQAEEFFIMQDGVSAAYIFNGASARRAVVGEIPTGTVMSYTMGRLWIASPDRRQFVAGDLVYGPSGTATYSFRDAVLKMTENDLLVTGGAFSVPNNAGEITAMIGVANLDVANGQGPLQVFTATMGFSVNAPTDRTIWKQVTYPLVTASLVNFGPLSQNGCVQINSDVWFRSQDGVRSFVLGRRNFSTSIFTALTWANTPISDEMRPILELDQQVLLDRASSVNFDNRFLTTISPVYSTHGVRFRGLAALNFSTISGIGRQSPPAWEGVWTGVRILQILKATVNKTDRCFIFALDTNNKIVLWELSKADKFDQSNKRIEWSYESRSMRFLTPAGADSGLKHLVTGQHSIDELTGTANFVLQVRPDQYPVWMPWASWSDCATFQDCDTPKCGSPQTGPRQFLPQFRPDTRLPRPPDSCDVVSGKPLDLGFEFQVRETITGYCRIKRVLLHAHVVDESPLGECPGESPCVDIAGCESNPFTYQAD